MTIKVGDILKHKETKVISIVSYIDVSDNTIRLVDTYSPSVYPCGELFGYTWYSLTTNQDDYKHFNLNDYIYLGNWDFKEAFELGERLHSSGGYLGHPLFVFKGTYSNGVEEKPMVFYAEQWAGTSNHCFSTSLVESWKRNFNRFITPTVTSIKEKLKDWRLARVSNRIKDTASRNEVEAESEIEEDASYCEVHGCDFGDIEIDSDGDGYRECTRCGDRTYDSYYVFPEDVCEILGHIDDGDEVDSDGEIVCTRCCGYFTPER